MSKEIRCDKWKLAVGKHLPVIRQTISVYRLFVQYLIGVIYSNWTEIACLTEQGRLKFVENLIHTTKKNNSKYKIFDRKFYKFPSYLRRAAIMAAIGQVSSFVTRYATWQSGIRKKRTSLPPKLNTLTNIFPVLYSGNCIFYHEEAVQIKVFKNNDWVWQDLPVLKKGERHLPHEVLLYEQKSPSLVMKGNLAHLAVPFEVSLKEKLQKEKHGNKTKEKIPDIICNVDLGINNPGVCSILLPDGTVTARLFIDRAADIDRRDRRLMQISIKAKETIAENGKLSKGFCRGLYRKSTNINREISQSIANEIFAFAILHGATVVVFENMKGYRPRGGRKKTTLRQRFHGWLHRRVARLVENKMKEHGKSIFLVNPRGTSKQAFDGSGLVVRDKKNYSMATFPNGKRYHSDLSSSYNIGAKYYVQKLRRRDSEKTSKGQNPVDVSRVPITLSTLWDGPVREPGRRRAKGQVPSISGS